MEREKRYSSEDFKHFIKNINQNKSLEECEYPHLLPMSKKKDIGFLKELFKKKRKDETVKLL